MTKKYKSNEFVVKKERTISVNLPFPFILKILLVIIALLICFFILYFKHIILYWNKEKKYYSLLFTLLVSGTILLFLTPFGIVDMSDKWYIKIPFFFFVVYLVYYGFEYIGIGIIFRTTFQLLRNPIYESNSRKGIMFLFDNLYVFFIVWFIYLPFMSKNK